MDINAVYLICNPKNSKFCYNKNRIYNSGIKVFIVNKIDSYIWLILSLI